MDWQEWQLKSSTSISDLASKLLNSKPAYSTRVNSSCEWKYCFFIERAADSQYDLLVQTGDDCTEAILCCAGSGVGFHGLRQRPWVALPGNLHVSALFRPNRKLPNGGICFTALAVVTVLETIDSMGITDASVKWVNDILIDEAKVGGVLVHMKTQGEKVTSALVGIGLNVEVIPEIVPTMFVPKTGALREYAPDPTNCTQGRVFRKLYSTLSESYKKCIAGEISKILKTYRERSIVMGRNVTVYEDDESDRSRVLVSGRVNAIGENLELWLEGSDIPAWKGRLVLQEPEE
jgi:biotin-[acetyl-CoA-carboxylase] ligase BirA-like protein